MNEAPLIISHLTLALPGSLVVEIADFPRRVIQSFAFFVRHGAAPSIFSRHFYDFFRDPRNDLNSSQMAAIDQPAPFVCELTFPADIYTDDILDPSPHISPPRAGLHLRLFRLNYSQSYVRSALKTRHTITLRIFIGICILC